MGEEGEGGEGGEGRCAVLQDSEGHLWNGSLTIFKRTQNNSGHR